ncbi:MAG: helix-turn-helix domain-containing protein [Chlamydiales bacterium]|nr:helix-turn-helix domain-containing protein [Chlamydiales bacterium]
MKETLKMTVKEAERLSVMRQIDKKILTIKKGSEELGLSLRQAKRLRKKYKERGEEGLISLKRGKTSNRRTEQGIKRTGLRCD